MYNRYVPQPDGSFRRSRIQTDPPKVLHRTTAEPAEEPVCQPAPEQKQEPCPRPTACPRARHRPTRPQHTRQENTPVGSFLKNLIPKDFDTSDLMIVLLLLLMAGDCPEDQNNALLTLALYLFM